MSDVEGARTFLVEGDAYDYFMGRYSRPLGAPFADLADVREGQTAVDVGCGPGALTSELVRRLGPASVFACDPSPTFVAANAGRHPGVEVVQGSAEAIPFADGRFDHSLAQLVFHFVTDPDLAAREMMRVVRPGGTVSACVWDFTDGMEMLNQFWAAASAVDTELRGDERNVRFGRPGEIAAVFEQAGMQDVSEKRLTVTASYQGFDELWSGFEAGIGPAGTYTNSREPEVRARLRDELFTRLGSPSGGFTLPAVAIAAIGRVPAEVQRDR